MSQKEHILTLFSEGATIIHLHISSRETQLELSVGSQSCLLQQHYFNPTLLSFVTSSFDTTHPPTHTLMTTGSDQELNTDTGVFVSYLAPEFRELAHIVVDCHFERSTGHGVPPRSVQKLFIHDKIQAFGSTKLKQLWQERSKRPSFGKRTYIDIVLPCSNRPLFRQYRDKLLAKMRAESLLAADDVQNLRAKNIDIWGPQGQETVVGDDGEQKGDVDGNDDEGQEHSRDNDDKASGMLPDLQELARLVAECTVTNSKQICHEMLALKVQSSECQILKDRWNGVARLSRFQRDGYSLLIPQSMRIPFQIHLDDLISSCNNDITGVGVATAAAKPNTETRRPDDVTSDEIDNCREKGDEGGLSASPSLPVGSPSGMPPDLQDLARLVAECMGTNSNTICHDMLALKVQSSGCQILKDRWNGVARLSRFQRDGYSMLIPQSMRILFHIYLVDLIPSCNNDIRGGPVATAAVKPNAETGKPNDVTIDGIPNCRKKGEEGRLSASLSLPVGSPSAIPSDLQELARLVAECMGANSNKICHDMLALKVLSSECQILKDRWNGVARLPRFQRDGYSMLIPQSMRKLFQIYRDHLLSSCNNDTTGASVAPAKQNVKLTCPLKEPAPVVTPCPKKTPKQLAETAAIVAQSLAATIAALNLATKKYLLEAADVAPRITAPSLATKKYQESSDAAPRIAAPSLLTKMYQESDDAAAKKRPGTAAFSNVYHGVDEANTKRLKIFGPVPRKSLEECNFDISLFFKWRRLRMDMAFERFLDDFKGGRFRRAKLSLETHYGGEIVRLRKLKVSCWSTWEAGSPQCLLLASFFKLVGANFKAFFDEMHSEASEGDKRDRYRIFLYSEKACVRRQLEMLK